MSGRGPTKWAGCKHQRQVTPENLYTWAVCLDCGGMGRAPLTEGMMRVVFAVGPAGSGKTTFLKKLLPHAEHVEVAWTQDAEMLGDRMEQSWIDFRAAVFAGKDVTVEATTERGLWQRVAEAREAGYLVQVVRAPFPTL